MRGWRLYHLFKPLEAPVFVLMIAMAEEKIPRIMHTLNSTSSD